jgi:glycosyltransferase involved in cell wall biosynthesis
VLSGHQTARPVICTPFEDLHMGGSYIATLPLLSPISRGTDTSTANVVTHNNGPWKRYLTSRGIASETVCPLVMPGRDGGFWATAPGFIQQTISLALYIRRNGINIVHANEESIAATWLPACRLSGAKLVWQQHGVPTPSRFLRFMRARSDALIAASEFIKARLIDEGCETDAVVINSFETNHSAKILDPDHRKKLKIQLSLPIDQPIIAFIGSLSEQKRPKILIASIQYISRQSDVKPKVLIFGDNRSISTRELAAVTETSNLDVDFMGHRSDLSEWLQASDILAAPAVNEGYGRALVEAMLAGAVVVAADSGGHREIVSNEKNGLLTTPDDPVALGNALLRVISDSMLRKNLTRTAYSDACGQHSHADYVASFENIYSEL